jgi:hypothetical protein
VPTYFGYRVISTYNFFDPFSKFWEIVALLDLSNYFIDSYMPAEFRLVDRFNEFFLFIFPNIGLIVIPESGTILAYSFTWLVIELVFFLRAVPLMLGPEERLCSC